MISIIKQLQLSGSKLMNVNGTIPKTFTYTSVGRQAVTSIVCLLKDEGATTFSNFGAKSALTNGVLIQVTQNGTTRTIATIKDNADLCMVFSDNQFGNGAVLSVLTLATPEGFGDTNNCFVGQLILPHAMDLADSDTITAIVQDDLSAVNVFQISLRASLD